MKFAKEIRVGNIIMVDSKPMIVLRSDVNGSSRTGFTYKWKMKSLLTNSPQENVFRGDDKFEVVVLDKKEVTYSYFADPLYVFMDGEYNQYEIEGENMGEALNYLKDGMQCEAVFYDGKAISVEMPTKACKRSSWCHCSSARTTRSKSTPVPTSTRKSSATKNCTAAQAP